MTFLRFLWCFGVGAEEAHFNFFFFLSTLYQMSFVVIHAFVEFKQDHKYSILARTYFNFLNTINGRGIFLIFMSLILAEKTDQGEVIVAIIVIVIGGCNIVLGWDQERQDIPDAKWQSAQGG